MNRGEVSRKNPYMIEILEVTQDILECLLEGNRKPQRPSEIARKLGVTRSRVFRVLKSLQGRGYVNFLKGGYILGHKFLEISEKLKEDVDVFVFAKSILVDLAQSTGEAAHLFVWMGDNGAVCTDRSSGNNRLQIEKIIGGHIPMNVAASPLVLLAYLTEKEQEIIIKNLEMVAFTDNTITDREELRRRLKKIRSRGYAIDNEEFEIGARAVSAPIFYKEDIVAAISLCTPSARFSEGRREQIIKLVVNAAQQISAKLDCLSE